MREREAPPDRRRRRALRTLGLARLAVAVVEVLALIENFRYVLGFRSFAAVNFFSYFTVQSAFLTVLVIGASGVVAVLGRREPHWFTGVRCLVTTYVVISGIVFGLIVYQARATGYRIDVPPSDQVLHFVVPVVLVVDWLLETVLGVRHVPVTWRMLWWAPLFPALWLVFTLVRGPSVGWYPYFFLDPLQVGGAPGIAFYCAIVLAVILVVAVLLVAATRIVRREGAGTLDPEPDAAADARVLEASAR
ncbi:Pr6Pr family membrane protein [Agromyces sp. SYSU T00194]|uniref:Pr6Pr family membrane protein n=1 Tax=Agromyces chitinivorans TaxID=3158560 RepID=UPI003398E8F1